MKKLAKKMRSRAILRVTWIIGLLSIFIVPAFFLKNDQEKAEILLKELRCVSCPNQNIAESTAPIASAMREEIIQRYQKGESTQTIREYLISQYGDYISYRPLFKPQTWFLWLSPLVLLFVGLLWWFSLMTKGKTTS